MIERFIMRHQRRHRIARLIRLANLTIEILPVITRITANVISAYAQAWNGPKKK